MLYLVRVTTIFLQHTKVLHFAPERCLYERLTRAPLIDYTTVDLCASPMVDHQLDITQMSFRDSPFDLIICSHVLEYVEDDASALSELRRVVRPGGQVLLVHPIDAERPKTFEDPGITDPDERLRAFGQADQVRIYGRDFIERVRAAGFMANCVRLADELPEEVVVRCGLRDTSALRADDIYVCS